MHKLARQVRFSINPFLPVDAQGYNSYVSKPAGEGLSIFFELCVELIGKVEPATGFVANVIDIDNNVRKYAVPIFAKRIREDFQQGEHIGFPEVAELLKSSWGQLADKFGAAKLGALSLKLNPFRKVVVDPVGNSMRGDNPAQTPLEADCSLLTGQKEGISKGSDGEDYRMIYFSEKFQFAATHKLWNDNFSAERNLEVFGKCANPAGHGHNYIVEVTIKKAAKGESFCIGDFERIVDENLIKVVDHKNLNVDVPYFTKAIPTVENITTFAWENIVGKFGEAALHCVTIWETDKTSCSYYG